MHSVAFILECIVANPVLFNRKHEYYQNETIKLKIWNDICVVHYEKREWDSFGNQWQLPERWSNRKKKIINRFDAFTVQNNDFEFGDEDLHFEIKHSQRTIERLLSRLARWIPNFCVKICSTTTFWFFFMDFSPLSVCHKPVKVPPQREVDDTDSEVEVNIVDGTSISRSVTNNTRHPMTINIALQIMSPENSKPVERMESKSSQVRSSQKRAKMWASPFCEHFVVEIHDNFISVLIVNPIHRDRNVRRWTMNVTVNGSVAQSKNWIDYDKGL